MALIAPGREHPDIHIEILFLRHAPGDISVRREKTLVKWLWSLKPAISAMSARGSLVFEHQTLCFFNAQVGEIFVQSNSSATSARNDSE